MNNIVLKKLNLDIHYITVYYKKLVSYTKQNQSVGSINEWIIDNYYLISEQQIQIEGSLKKKSILKIKNSRKKQIRELLYSFLVQQNFKFSLAIVFEQINNYQEANKDYFSYDEFDYINIVLRIIIINELKKLAMKLNNKLDETHSIDRAFKIIEKNQYQKKNRNIYDYIKINNSILDNHYYIEELNYKLSELDSISESVFKKLNELLIKNSMSLKDIIKEQHEEKLNENLLMVNLFESLKKMIKVKMELLYSSVSYTEKALINEKVNIYDSMYESSKAEYRNQIKKTVKNNKINEYQYIKNLVKVADNNEKHIGFYLFEEKDYKTRTVVYITTVFALTLILSFIGSYFFGITGFLLLLIPSLGYVIDIVNQILLKTVNTKSLFKIKVEESFPAEYSTMVVIPTILNSANKVNQMFDNLELYYLSNRTTNLYFTLLGDVTSETTENVAMDQIVIDAGIKKVNQLNEKYGSKVFNFAYRNRFYNESEASYLGYERKRGALLHFNQLLLHKLNKEDQDLYFNYHTFKDFKTKIKYVITLDADTKLLLNTALKLIGAMIHPMNKPVLSKDRKKVIAGYAIMQPRISIELEATDKSQYTQLFAGLGGLDIYTTKSFDLYQDVFNEGSFVGKGIYDLEIFDEIINNNFPDNLILSHDLLEGNYLRCGFVSDVEFFDGFPSKYLNDAGRHHRWTRGDWQIISWLKNKVRNKKNEVVKNPINLIEKWKIFDNLVRSLKSLALLLLIIYGFTISKLNPTISLVIVMIIIATPIFFYLFAKIFSKQKYDIFLKYYLNLITGIFAVVIKSFIILALLPYETCLYLDAIIKSVYRMLISKKNLLNWITSEEVEKRSKNNLLTYINNFKANYLFTLLIIWLAYYFKQDYIYVAYFLASIWIFAPFLMFFISLDIKYESQPLSGKAKGEIRDIAIRTWSFFEDYLTREFNYLMPDNFQSNREEKIDYRTSPTNVGLSITSVISAYELKIINETVAIDLLANILKSVEGLAKWNGHLYNWYNIYEMKAIPPFFISTADSGNFVSSLYVLKGFLEHLTHYKVLEYRVNKLIAATDFSKLYNHDLDVFSVGYTINEGKLVPYHYNNFLSESRLSSFIAIAKGDVPFKHWFCLDKTLTKYKLYKGVVSWTGTMFEYYMPLIFMKTYKHTLLDETYLFAYYAQKEFMREADPKLPWGITESAYNELDDSQNYKYKAFGVPHLKFQDSETPLIVIAPYGSLMALGRYPNGVYENIKKLKKLDMYGKYGLYEAYDNEDKVVVKAYYSHHQGMILSSIANYFHENIIQEYFHADKNIKAIELLLKEKVQIRPYIDLKIERYKKYSYKRDIQDTDVREQTGIMPMPSVGVLSNGFYSTFINDRGIGFSKYKNLFINRYRNVTDENYGVFIYIKNLKTNNFWTNTYLPAKKAPDKYRVVFASDRIKYTREDEDIITNTEIMVTKEHNAEIRKITFENTSNDDINLEVTSYSEIIMARNEEDIAHRAFNSLTIASEIDEKTSSLIFKRSSRTKENTKYFVVNRMFIDGEDSINFEFETSRANFIGRNNTTANPFKICNSERLSCDIDDLIDPIMSIRKNIKIKANSKKIIYLLVGFGKSREQIDEIVNTYNNKKIVDVAFEMATILNNMRNHYAGLNGRELMSYNTMLKYIYQTLPISIKRHEILHINNLSQDNLWKFGVSGDLPLILVNIDNAEDSGFIKEILQAYEFYKSRAIYLDVVIINNEVDGKKELVAKYINNLMYRINNLNYFENSPGNVYTISELSNEELVLFKTITKIYFDASIHKSLNQQIFDLDLLEPIKLEVSKTSNLITLLETKSPKIDFDNQYGGFSKNGSEYHVFNNDTPAPWSNIIANETFGTVITNNLGGFTYAYNSRQFKLTSWSNDAVGDPASEAIYINKQKFIPSLVKHGFGYSIFIANTEDYDMEIKVFVPRSDNLKLYDIKINNKKSTKIKLDIDFVIKPVLGETEEQTNSHILVDFDVTQNSLIMQNVYNKVFRNEKVFMSSSEKIVKYDLNDVSTKTISISIDLFKDESKELSFMLGCANNTEDIINKYQTKEFIANEFIEVVEYWKEKLSNIVIKTPDKSFDYMMNGWYLYQVYASRLYAKSAFYQVGGAIGFRDQLQDSMSLIYSNPTFTRDQILKHAKHQFIEGDVLHWWHEELSLGARTKFSDDYLWLLYVTYEYLKVTNNYTILDEKVVFVEGEHLGEQQDEKGINYSYSATQETLYYHLKLSITKALNQLGTNGLPLMGSGDWNDGMNKVGNKGIGESVWVGFFLYDLLNKIEEIAPKEDVDFIKTCHESAIELKKSINANAWDGSWYLRAFFDNGDTLGSKNNASCQIDLLSQSWSILSNVIDPRNIKPLIKEIDNRLVDNDNHLIKLLSPAFFEEKNDPGYISDYLPGVRENGAQYTHATLWYIMSLIKIGEINKAYGYLKMINPINRTTNAIDVLKYKTEPYVIAADIYSKNNYAGRGGWTWYTGSASWAYKIGIEKIIGLEKTGNTLTINPHIDSTWLNFEFTYKYLNTIYDIKVNNKDHVSEGVSSIMIDEKKVKDNLINLIDDKKKHIIIVNMGGKE